MKYDPALNEDTLSERPALEQLKAMGYSILYGEKFDSQELEVERIV